MNRFLALVRNLVRRDRVERDLELEVDAYLELLVAEKVRAGMSEEDARRAARMELGGPDQVREKVREVRAGAFLEHLGRDLRFGLRGLRRNPGFSSFAILTFALAIGGITAIATLVDAVLIRPLPYPESDRLVVVLEAGRDTRGAGYSVARPNFLDWEARNRVFGRMALYEYLGFNLSSGEGEPEQVGGLRATAGLFPALRVVPILGRGILAEDERGENGAVVVLSHGLWQRRFGGDSAIVGRTVMINQAPAVVVGVMPKGFAFPSANQQLWIPLIPGEEDLERGAHSFFSIARLRPGVSVAEARTAMRTIGDQLAREYPEVNGEETVNVTPLHDLWLFDVARTLRILLVAVGLVGVIATANVASLLIARGIARRRELAARLALGGTARRIGGQLVTEAVLLAMLGAVAGFWIARLGIPALLRLAPMIGDIPFRDLSGLAADWRVFGFAALAALLTGVGAGLVPAFAVVPTAPGLVLKEGAAHGATARTGKRLRNALVAVEVALAFVVLTGAVLLVVSIERQLEVDPGLDPRNVVTMSVALPQPNFYGEPTRPDFCARLSERVSAVPGVTGVSATSHVPLRGADASRSFVVEGQPDPGLENLPSGSYGVVCPDYFKTMGIPLLEGRDFAVSDRVGAPPVVIVNQVIARRYFGKRIRFGRFETIDMPWVTVIGVAGNVRHHGLSAAEPRYLYRPYSQTVWPSMTMVARTTGDPAPVVAPLRAALGQVVPTEPVGRPLTMVEIVAGSLGPVRFPMRMFTLFAAEALLLAAIGIFGVASQSVVQRTRELGIRRAVGASEPELYRLVIKQSLGPVAVGIIAGVITGVLSAGVLRSLLFGIEPTSPVALAIVAAGLALVAVIASLVPARRAARIDPMVALRDD